MIGCFIDITVLEFTQTTQLNSTCLHRLLLSHTNKPEIDMNNGYTHMYDI